jgi:hypothetical protein
MSEPKDPSDVQPSAPPPLPAEPPRFILLPRKTPWQRACDRLAIEQAMFEREAARAAEGEDPQY